MSSAADIAWEDLYVSYLPEHLRPAAGDPKFIAAAGDVIRAGWTPMQAAAIVAGRSSYDDVRNPAAVAVMRLEDLGRRGAGEAPAHARPCPIPGCYRGWIDNDTTTTPCPGCRPMLAARVATIPPPGKRSESDYTYLRDKGR